MNQQKIDTRFKQLNGINDEDFEAYKDLFRTTPEYARVRLQMSMQNLGNEFKRAFKGVKK